jgi:ribose transport system substrate-binding protein
MLRGCLAVVVLGLALTLSACAKSGGSTSQTSASAVSPVAPATGCGSYSGKPPADPDGVLASLDNQHRAAYLGYPSVQKSAWSQWKPKHGPPWHIEFVLAGSLNQFQIDATNELRRLVSQDKQIGTYHIVAPGDNLDIPTQLQEFHTAIARKPDLIVAEPLQPDAFNGAVSAAGKAGIPVVTFLGEVNSPFAVNLNNNAYLAGAQVASIIARQLKGKGNAIYVHGYPSVTADIEGWAATQNVIKRCPGIKIVGQADGLFANGTAKGELLKVLATHPQPIAAVLQSGGMAPGIFQAFQSTGRQIPVISEIGGVDGSLSWWLAHRDTYTSAGAGNSSKWFAAATVSVATRLLEGQGPKLNDLIPPVPLITAQNLDQWARPGLPMTDFSTADGPRNSFYPESYLDGFFNSGHTP